MTYTIHDLQEWLRLKSEGYFAKHRLDPGWYREIDDFHPDEAQFLRAVTEGIIKVDGAGCCQFPSALNRKTGNPTEPGRQPGSGGLFSKPDTARLKTHVVKLEWREYLTQVAVLAELILDYKWPIELVAFDPEAKADWTFDLATFRDANALPPWVLAAEVKSLRSARELDVLEADLLRWSRQKLAPSVVDDSKSATAFRGLIRNRPDFLWLHAPGRRRKTFRMSYEEKCLWMEDAKDTEIYFRS